MKYIVDYEFPEIGRFSISKGTFSDVEKDKKRDFYLWWNGCGIGYGGKKLHVAKAKLADMICIKLINKKEEFENKVSGLMNVIKEVDPDNDWIENYRKTVNRIEMEA